MIHKTTIINQEDEPTVVVSSKQTTTSSCLLPSKNEDEGTIMKQKPSSLSVSFAPSIILHEVHEYSTMDVDNKNELWYSYKELKEMKLNIKRILQKFNDDNNFLTTFTRNGVETNETKQACNHDYENYDENKEDEQEEEEFCFRGIEMFTREGKFRRKHRIDQSIVAVLQEQDMQRLFFGVSYYNDEVIRQVYTKCTFPSQLIAYNLGIEDELFSISSSSSSSLVR